MEWDMTALHAQGRRIYEKKAVNIPDGLLQDAGSGVYHTSCYGFATRC